MSEPADSRVAVYIDFDNIVISRYEQVHGKGSFQKDKVRYASSAKLSADAKLASALVDIGAILDYASSFGPIVISRAYADWSVPVNASYDKQLIERAVDLTQLFPLVASMKNGADIRLSVDVMEDLFRLPDITHVVVVAGDSDYVALAQRCSRLGRSVIGVGMAGSTSAALKAACTKFRDYDDLDGVPAISLLIGATAAVPSAVPSGVSADAAVGAAVGAAKPATVPAGASPVKIVNSGTKTAAQAAPQKGTQTATKAAAQKKAATAQKTATAIKAPTAQKVLTPGEEQSRADKASNLLVKALGLVGEKDEWHMSQQVKSQMLRLDPAFSEKALGFSSFTAFVKSRSKLVDLLEEGQVRKLRLTTQS